MDYLIIKDCKESILKSETWKASIDYSLFHLTSERRILDKEILADCTFFDLYLNDKVRWGAQVPSTFQFLFPELMKLLVPEEQILLLNVVDLYEGFFEENKFIEEFLRPRGYKFFFLDEEINGTTSPRLFFECPVHEIQILNEIAFNVMDISIEGFVINKPNIEQFKQLPEMGNTDTMFRHMVKLVYFSFHIWGDHNGIFVVTDKFGIPALEKRLHDSQFDEKVAKYLEIPDQLP